MTDFFDISPPLHAGIAVWPGDVSFQRRIQLCISEVSPVNLSSVTLSLHTGAHADAPFHYSHDGLAIDEVPLEPFWGPCQLATVKAEGQVRVADLEGILRSNPSRLIVRCNPDSDPDHFSSTFVSFSEDAAHRIGAAGVRLIGTDGPSVDPADSKELLAHRAFGRYSTFILENLILDGVPDGVYELVALPLRIAAGDGSPVRAVLRRRAASA